MKQASKGGKEMWMQQFFDSISKLTDILNVGRLIFYTSAGFFVFYPTVMIFQLLGKEKDKLTTFFTDLRHTAPTDIGLIFTGSLVVGFLIAAAGFALVIQPLSEQERKENQNLSVEKHSFPYCYPHLKNKEDVDYQDWLISEFYRYVEIVTYIPIGFLLGLVLFFAYSVIYLLFYAVAFPFAGAGGGFAFLLILAVLLGILWFYVWEEFWKPKIIVPTLRAYSRAKQLLIYGTEDFREQCKGRAQIKKPEKATANQA
jgi:hypothetical protein